MLCRDLSVAAIMSVERSIDCVTLDGDEASRRGVFSGGSRGYDVGGSGGVATSRLTILGQMKTLEAEGLVLEESLERVERELSAVEKEVSDTLTGMQTTENHRKRTRFDYGQTMTFLERLKTERREHLERLVRQQETHHELVATMSTMENRISALESEMSSPMVASLSTEQKEELRTARRCWRQYQSHKDHKLSLWF